MLGTLLCLLSAMAIGLSGVARWEPKPAGARELALLSFNIRYGTAPDGENAWPKRRDLVVRVMRDADADVVGLQEALHEQIAFITGEMNGYTSTGVGRDDGKEAGEYSCILFRAARFELREHGTLWLSDTPEEPGSRTWGNGLPRIVTWARLEEKKREQAADGGTVLVFNTHLDHQSQPSRERAAEFIVAEIGRQRRGDEPVVLMGDFNAGEENRVVRFLRGGLERAVEEAEEARPGERRAVDGAKVEKRIVLTDTFRAVHPKEEAVGTFHAFSGKREGEKIDSILVDGGIKTLSAEIIRTERGGRFPSDHFPVSARVSIGPRESGGVPSGDPGR